LEFLDDKANKSLDKALEGKSDGEKGMIKAMIQLEFTTSIKMDENGNIVHGKRDFSKKNKYKVVKTLKKFIANSCKDTIGANDVLKDFLSFYTRETTSEKTRFSQESKSNNLKQLCKKEIVQPAEKIKVSLFLEDKVSRIEKNLLKDALEYKS